MRIKVYTKDGQKDLLLLKNKQENSYSFVNLNDEYIDSNKFPTKDDAIRYLDEKKASRHLQNYKIVDDKSFLDDGVFIGQYFVPNKNPKKINCKRDDLIFEGPRIIGVKGMKFTCDNCSTPMHVMRGANGFFFGCNHWKTSESCKKNTITLNILD